MVSTATSERLARARAVAAAIPDPELPMVTIAELGILRDVRRSPQGVEVAITPTYSGCPAMAAIRDDIKRVLQEDGFTDVSVRIELDPAWSSDWITAEGRAKLRAAGVSPPGAAPPPPQLLSISLGPITRQLSCPHCGSTRTELTSEFGSTACKALYRCLDCREPFEHMKEI